MKRFLKLGSIAGIVLLLCSCSPFGTLKLNLDDDLDIKSGIKESKNDYSSNVSAEALIVADGTMLIKVLNNSNKALDVEAEVTFYDNENNLVNDEDVRLYDIPSKAKAIENIYLDKDIKFDTYKVEVKNANEPYDKPISQENIKIINTNDTGKKITTQISNTHTETVEITASVLYYKENKIVGYDNASWEEIKSNGICNISFDYPVDEDYDNIKFDGYEVFVSRISEVL